MTSSAPLSLTALGLAVWLVPVSSPVAARAVALADRGRLARVALPRRALPAPRPAWCAVLLSVGAAAGAALAGGPALGVAAGVAVATIGYLVVIGSKERVARRQAGALLAAVRLMAAELEAGAAPAAAFAAAGEVAGAHHAVFAAAAAGCRRGDPPVLPGAELAALAQAWHLATVTGVPLAAVLSRVADDLGARAAQRRGVAAAVAGARSSAYLLAGLPVLGLLLGAAMQADPLGVLLGTPAGRLLCLVGVVLDSAGVLWTVRLTARAASP